ncbi:MAG: site-specific tyrosine recombinase [Acidimicrobiales bacterium]
MEEYLLYLTIEKGRSVNTIAAYRRDLRSWDATLSDRSVTVLSASQDDVLVHLHGLKDSGKAPASVARSMVAVRSLYRYLALEGHRGDDPTAQVEMPRVPRGLPKPLSVADVTSLIEASAGPKPWQRRDRAMLELLYGTGIRIGELVGVSLSDFDSSDALLRVFGKGAKERVIPVGSYAMQSMVDWLDVEGRGAMEPKRWASRDASEAMFLNRRGGRLSRQGAWGVVKKHGTAVGVGAKLSPHVLRHSCATHMLDGGADIRTVQELLGHASVTTTQVYTKVSQARLWQVYQSAHPRAQRG